MFFRQYVFLWQTIDERLLKTTFSRSTVLSDLIYAENENLTRLKPEREAIYQHISTDTVLRRCKTIICTKLMT